MLNILIGEIFDNTAWSVDTFFNFNYENEWLGDSLVKEMIKDIDKSDIVDLCVISPVLGMIAPERLSGGVKGLIWLLKCSEDEMKSIILDISLFGENCQKWLLKIGDIRDDIIVTCNTYDLAFEELDTCGSSIKCLNDSEVVFTSKDWVKKMLKYQQ